MNGYELSRLWFDFCFENPEKIKPNHTALYFFIIEHCNRLGWKEKFGLPSLHTMESIGIRSKNTFYKTFNDLVDWGFVNIVEKSKNQNTANIISLSATSNFESASMSALDYAIIKSNSATSNFESANESARIQHISQREYSTCVSGGNIDKPINHITNKPLNQQTKDVCEENQNEDFKNSEKEEKEKSSAQKEKEIQEIKSSGFFDQMCNYFSQTTEVMQMRAFGDLVRIYNTGLFEEFSLQTQAYMAYKKISGEKVHRFQNYVYEWQNEDWVNKLKKQHQNGKSNYNNGSNSGYKPASTDTERIIRELESDFANGNIPGQYQ